MLFQYQQDCQRLLRDTDQRHLNPDDIRVFVNRARREVALRTQCIRAVPPISGPILSIAVTNPGTGYTNPAVAISAPDQASGKAPNPIGRQATAVAQRIGSVISNVSLTNGGDGYFQPNASITDPTGSGATVTVTTVPLSVLNPRQEEYSFANFPIATLPGVKSVFAVLNVSSLFNNLRYTWIYKSFTEYQAYIRTYTQQYFYTPAVWTQYGQGTNGTFLCYPIPAQTYQFEPDCLCLPIDLVDDRSFEAIPEPWTDSIPYAAIALLYQELQNVEKAQFYWQLFNSYVNKYGMWARPIRAPVVYQRRY